MAKPRCMSLPVRERRQGQTVLPWPGPEPRRADHAHRDLPAFDRRASRHHQRGIKALFAELVDLPEFDLSLQVPLPSIWSPQLDRAVEALHADDTEEFDHALAHMVDKLDTVVQRLLLARAVVVLRDAGRLSKRLAALALIELDREHSAFFASSVAESIAVLAGKQRTPSGLVVATA